MQLKKMIKKIPGAKRLVNFYYSQQLQKKDIKNIFTDYYVSNKWKDKESRSGTGSNLEVTTVLRDRLKNLLIKYNVTTVLDLPCGDYNWMNRVDYNFEQYTGADIVDPLIGNNNKKFANKNTRFVIFNALEDDYPDAELLLCRDLWVHLSFEDINKFLEKFHQSSAKFLLATTYCQTIKNEDILTGLWRPINLYLPPFSFPKPAECLIEKTTESNGQYKNSKSLCLWKKNEIPVSII